MRVPENLWVVDYDDIPMSSWKLLGLSSVRQPIDEMARLALEILRARTEDPDTEVVQKRFPTKLILRGSTGDSPT
jgi:DNA-binding LacI/PurR family transcriptional regulator